MGQSSLKHYESKQPELCRLAYEYGRALFSSAAEAAAEAAILHQLEHGDPGTRISLAKYVKEHTDPEHRKAAAELKGAASSAQAGPGAQIGSGPVVVLAGGQLGYARQLEELPAEIVDDDAEPEEH
jgi:hypothetical protein